MDIWEPPSPCPQLTQQQEEQDPKAGSPPHCVFSAGPGKGCTAQGGASGQSLQGDNRRVLAQAPETLCLPSAPGWSWTYPQGPRVYARPSAHTPGTTPVPPPPARFEHPGPPQEPRSLDPAPPPTSVTCRPPPPALAAPARCAHLRGWSPPCRLGRGGPGGLKAQSGWGPGQGVIKEPGRGCGFTSVASNKDALSSTFEVAGKGHLGLSKDTWLGPRC